MPHGKVLNAGDIGAQTRNVFENMKSAASPDSDSGSRTSSASIPIMYSTAPTRTPLNIGKTMTQVRLEYFPDPGPVGTAVRIKGMPYDGQLIQIEGVAMRGDSRTNRQRIMPAGSWDWSIALPLSQGWRVGGRIFVGGQISADAQGKSVHVGDLDAQTRNIYKFIGNVLSDAGASFDDVVHLKVCFKHDSREPSGQSFADRIMDVTTEYVSDPGPVLTAFGVDLLYPGLVLEIDAMAIVDPARRTLQKSGPGRALSTGRIFRRPERGRRNLCRRSNRVRR